MAKLTSSQKAELQDAFNLFDSDQSGKISRNELKNVLNALNIQVTDNELKQTMSQMDGDIEFDEFCRVMGQTYFKKYTREELQNTFRNFDSDGSGYIQASELETIMSRLGKRMKKSEIDQMIKSLDTTGDGQIGFDEFVKLFD
ncbi:unnamed protein product [Didymodactylos carnosus]|uniref:EF-hand domain-containing protein n=2 Tax=Didymodactylos carnosus TaxID=1234261 RepID=A0A815C0Q1_9BILA|nr:unnamed protein product [Didymodactylos carnosus]CAF4069702.1 unnamed protein product [Didymodactylos carnosus]